VYQQQQCIDYAFGFGMACGGTFARPLDLSCPVPSPLMHNVLCPALMQAKQLHDTLCERPGTH
jgi:hypothetical protein